MKKGGRKEMKEEERRNEKKEELIVCSDKTHARIRTERQTTGKRKATDRNLVQLTALLFVSSLSMPPPPPLFPPNIDLSCVAIQFVKAMLSFDPEDIARAIMALRQAEALALRGANVESLVASWGRWLTGGKSTVTSENVHCQVMMAGKARRTSRQKR